LPGLKLPGLTKPLTLKIKMACLTALGILRSNMGSDIKRHEVQTSVMVLIAVAADL